MGPSRIPIRASSKCDASAEADALVPDIPDQRTLRPDRPVRSVEQFVAFLEAMEAAVGSEDQPRGPTTGHHFRL